MKTYKVDFTGATGVHIEYITGPEKLVLEYVAKTEQNYGTKASTPEVVKMPEKLMWNSSKVDLVGWNR